jgi:chorismate mutase
MTLLDALTKRVHDCEQQILQMLNEREEAEKEWSVTHLKKERQCLNYWMALISQKSNA